VLEQVVPLHILTVIVLFSLVAVHAVAPFVILNVLTVPPHPDTEIDEDVQFVPPLQLNHAFDSVPVQLSVIVGVADAVYPLVSVITNDVGVGAVAAKTVDADTEIKIKVAAIATTFKSPKYLINRFNIVIHIASKNDAKTEVKELT